MEISITRNKRYDDHMIAEGKPYHDLCATVFDLIIDGVFIMPLGYAFVDNKIDYDILENKRQKIIKG